MKVDQIEARIMQHVFAAFWSQINNELYLEAALVDLTFANRWRAK